MSGQLSTNVPKRSQPSAPKYFRIVTVSDALRYISPFYIVEFDRIKGRIVELLPYSQEFKGVSVEKSVAVCSSSSPPTHLPKLPS